jgi:UDP-N-acetylglucosamine 3-dehydrogenase
MRKINVGVVGAGYWGKKIVSEYMQLSKQNSQINLQAVCDPLEENLKGCEVYRIPFLTKFHKEVVASPDVDVINICTPNETHYEICREALEAGKHVLVEKPMTLSSADAYELIELAHKQNLVLSVGHIFRFNNALRMTRDLIKSGFFGDLFYLRLQWTTLMPPVQGRDIIMDLAPHPFDIVNFLLEQWPTKITCKAKAFRRKQLEEMAYILAEFRENAMAHIELSWLSPGKTREVCVMGSNRFAKIDCLSQDVKVFENNGFHDVYVKRNNTIEEELEHFIYCVQNNSVVNNTYLNESNGLLGAKVVRLLEIARKSIEEEKTESVDIK